MKVGLELWPLNGPLFPHFQFITGYNVRFKADASHRLVIKLTNFAIVNRQAWKTKALAEHRYSEFVTMAEPSSQKQELNGFRSW